MNKWTDTLNQKELDYHFAMMARLDPAMAGKSRKFYESRTAGQLSSLITQAWNIGDAEGYQLARSYFKQVF